MLFSEIIPPIFGHYQKRKEFIVRYLRLYWNYFLVRIGLRKVLPAYFINRIIVRECGEPLVRWQDIPVRKTIAKMLNVAQSHLPNGYSIRLVSGYRSFWEQYEMRKQREQKLMEDFPWMTIREITNVVSLEIAKQSGHFSGGSVDVLLLQNDSFADMGTRYLEFNNRTKTDYDALSWEQKQNRQILLSAMEAAGFINYPLEWWHFCYGDRMYAAYTHQKYAQYGDISPAFFSVKNNK